MDHNSKEYRDYLNELSHVPTWRKNDIIRHVNYRLPKEKYVFRNMTEEAFYESLIEETTMMQCRTGRWPVFELCEIDYDDPILDIYSDVAVQEHINKRHKRREEK
ncbi:MAG: hypothetical protein IKD87_06265 [Oscillospiraceae bacterium]|nr:hypothetical protein [Oscillospiraceae bacterium]